MTFFNLAESSRARKCEIRPEMAFDPGHQQDRSSALVTETRRIEIVSPLWLDFMTTHFRDLILSLAALYPAVRWRKRIGVPPP